mgnify:CR=1 FL=1
MPEPQISPTTVITPPKGWLGPNLPELWRYRELLGIFVWRDLKVRYKQTVLGVLWAILQPVATMAIFTMFFGRLVKVPSDGAPYSVFVFCGLVFWNYFSSALTTASNTLVDNEGIVKKIFFPRLLLPGAAAVTPAVDFFISTIVLFALSFLLGFTPGWLSLVLIPLGLLISVLTVIGLGSLLAAINVRYRDVRYIIPFFTQILLFLTPVIYPISIVPAKWQWVLSLNPLTGVITAARAAFLGTTSIDWSSLGISALIASVLFVVGIAFFRKTEHLFADVA